MKFTKKKEKWATNPSYIGKKCGYTATITFVTRPISGGLPFWYFMLSKGGEVYNSLHYDEAFDSQEDCVDYCEEKIEKLFKMQKQLKT